MLEFEPTVGELKKDQGGFVFPGNLRIINGVVYVDKQADCPKDRRCDSQIFVGHHKDGRHLINLKYDVSIQVADETTNRIPYINIGPGKPIAEDDRELRREIDNLRATKH